MCVCVYVCVCLYLLVCFVNVWLCAGVRVVCFLWSAFVCVVVCVCGLCEGRCALWVCACGFVCIVGVCGGVYILDVDGICICVWCVMCATIEM